MQTCLLPQLKRYKEAWAAYENWEKNIQQPDEPDDNEWPNGGVQVKIGDVSGAVNIGGEVKPPAFVYAIIPTIFVFFNIFALNMFLQYKKVGPWKDYLFGERFYIILSLAAKTVLAWMIFSGVFAP